LAGTDRPGARSDQRRRARSGISASPQPRQSGAWTPPLPAVRSRFAFFRRCNCEEASTMLREEAGRCLRRVVIPASFSSPLRHRSWSRWELPRLAQRRGLTAGTGPTVRRPLVVLHTAAAREAGRAGTVPVRRVPVNPVPVKPVPVKPVPVKPVPVKPVPVKPVPVRATAAGTRATGAVKATGPRQMAAGPKPVAARVARITAPPKAPATVKAPAAVKAPATAKPMLPAAMRTAMADRAMPTETRVMALGKPPVPAKAM
jgi:hypothetical protein